MKDVLAILLAAVACFGVLLLWPSPYSAHVESGMISADTPLVAD